MSDISNIADYASYYSSTNTVTASNVLEIDDFYKLMAAQLQNQDITNPMDQSDFMNQMTQIAVVQAIDTFTDISITSYAASLVGKEATVAEVNLDGSITEIFGKITATGLYSGEQIIFVNGNSYKLSQIMSIGRLPGNEEEIEEELEPEEEVIEEEVIEEPVLETPVVETEPIEEDSAEEPSQEESQAIESAL